MRLSSLLSVALLAVPTLAHADTILVGTNLSATNPGALVLCPGVGGCDDGASQFTLSTAVVIDSVSVVVSAPALNFKTPSNFTIGLGSQLGPGVTTGIGAGSIAIDPAGDLVTEEFTFTGLDLSLAAGTYYLGMAGSNVIWDYAQPLSTGAGVLGAQLDCDPTTPACSGGITKWDKITVGTLAFEIDGTAVPVVTPEPSTLALFGTGILGLAGVARRRFFS